MPEDTSISLTAEQLARLEERFSLRLPDDYRQFMQSYPHRLTTEDMGGGDTVATRQIVVSYDELVDLNVRVRNPDYWFFGEHPWPNHYFVIGGDVYGNSYFLDTSGEYPGVRFQDSDDWDVGHMADSLAGFAKLLEEGPPREEEEEED